VSSCWKKPPHTSWLKTTCTLPYSAGSQMSTTSWQSCIPQGLMFASFPHFLTPDPHITPTSTSILVSLYLTAVSLFLYSDPFELGPPR
jgi:hypothetical protein